MLGRMTIAATVAIFLANTAAAVARTHHYGYGYGYGSSGAYRNDLHHTGDTNGF